MIEKLMQNPVTKDLFWVSKSKSLGKGFHVSENKRPITKEEEFLIWFGKELNKAEILKEILEKMSYLDDNSICYETNDLYNDLLEVVKKLKEKLK